jgi:hypothetical protein
VAGLPVTRRRRRAQKADAIVFELRTAGQMELANVEAGIAALDGAVATDPVAGRYLQRSELMGARSPWISKAAQTSARNGWPRQGSRGPGWRRRGMTIGCGWR